MAPSQIESVEAGKYIFQNQVAHYTQITVSGDEAGHSSLPQNRQIVNLIVNTWSLHRTNRAFGQGKAVVVEASDKHQAIPDRILKRS